MPQNFRKDPDAVLDYQWNWTAWLAGDVIASHAVNVPAGLTKLSSSNSATAVAVWLAGGEAGVTYPVTCHVVTAGGRKDDRTIMICGWER